MFIGESACCGEDFVGHTVLFIFGKECLLLKIKTVFTLEVAYGPDGLGHDVDALRFSRVLTGYVIHLFSSSVQWFYAKRFL